MYSLYNNKNCFFLQELMDNFLQLTQSEVHVWCVIWMHLLYTPLKWTLDILHAGDNGK